MFLLLVLTTSRISRSFTSRWNSKSLLVWGPDFDDGSVYSAATFHQTRVTRLTQTLPLAFQRLFLLQHSHVYEEQVRKKVTEHMVGLLVTRFLVYSYHTLGPLGTNGQPRTLVHSPNVQRSTFDTLLHYETLDLLRSDLQELCTRGTPSGTNSHS